MVSLKQINEFVEAQPIAIVGVSRNPRKFGYTAYRELRNRGMNIIPVNPLAYEIMGEKCYRNLADLPAEIKGIIVLTKNTQTASVVRQAKAMGIKRIWIQQMAESVEALRELEGTDINYITNECILMHYKAKGIHRFHAMMKKLFGRFPK